MRFLQRAVLVWFALWNRIVYAQQDIAAWVYPRVAQLGDSIFIEGGYLQTGNFVDGKWQDVTYTTPTDGQLFNLSLATSFAGLEPPVITKVPATIPENSAMYVGGAIVANEHAFFTFGGLATDEESKGNTTISVAEFTSGSQSNSSTISMRPFQNPTPPAGENDTFWHRCVGASISVPQENLGFHFGGLVTAKGGSITWIYNEQGSLPNITSPYMIMCDTSSPTSIAVSCEQIRLPDWIVSRAEAEVQWLPYGGKGILVIIGGTLLPGDLTAAGLYPDYTDNNISMAEVVIFDIESQAWHLQKTLESSPGPPPTASFCTVATSAQDGSAHFVYAYGGYDGTGSAQSVAYDQVWVLSFPSFQWTLVNEGVQSHRRQAHRCVAPYPDQMISIGGTTEFGLNLENPDFIDIFNLNTLTWNSTYDPWIWEPYSIPKIIRDQIGGNKKGGLGTIPDSLNPEVAKLMGQKYPGKVREYQTYGSSLYDRVKRKLTSIALWLRLTIGVTGYLLISSAAIIAIVIIRRRQYYQQIDRSDIQIKSKRWLIRWMHNASALKDAKQSGTEAVESEAEGTNGFEPLRLSYVDDDGGDERQTAVDDDEERHSKGSTGTGPSLWTRSSSLLEEDGAFEMRPMINSPNVASRSML